MFQGGKMAQKDGPPQRKVVVEYDVYMNNKANQELIEIKISLIITS